MIGFTQHTQSYDSWDPRAREERVIGIMEACYQERLDPPYGMPPPDYERYLQTFKDHMAQQLVEDFKQYVVVEEVEPYVFRAQLDTSCMDKARIEDLQRELETVRRDLSSAVHYRDTYLTSMETAQEELRAYKALPWYKRILNKKS